MSGFPFKVCVCLIEKSEQSPELIHAVQYTVAELQSNNTDLPSASQKTLSVRKVIPALLSELVAVMRERELGEIEGERGRGA